MIFLFVLSACSSKTLATVGQYTISARDANLREQVAKVYDPKNQTPDVGLQQLIEAYSYAEILARNGKTVSDADLKGESNRLNASAHERSTLKRVKAIFKDRLGQFDEDSYLHVFVLPVWAERLIHSEFAARLPGLEESKARAIALRDEATRDPQHWQELAKHDDFKIGRWCISKRNGTRFEAEGDAPAKDAENGWEKEKRQTLDRWFKEIVASTKLNAMAKPVLEQSQQWMVLQLIDRKKNEACFNAAMIPKPNFSSWIESEKKSVYIRR